MALARAAHAIATTSARSRRRSGEVFKFLNDHLGPVLQAIPSVVKVVEAHQDGFGAGRWNSGSEDVGCNRLAAPCRAEFGPARRPVERISEPAGRGEKAHDVGRHIIWLYDKLAVLAGGFTPSA